MNGTVNIYANYFGDDYQGDDSDPESSDIESSDDDLDILVHIEPEKKRRLCRSDKSMGDKSSTEDEFEKEMNAELNVQVKTLEKQRRSSLSADSGPKPGSSSQSDNGQTNNSDKEQSNKEEAGSSEALKYYDDVYFDSDEEEMVTEGDARCRRKQLSNDDLLYDPDIDMENEKWVQKQRQQCVPKTVDKTTQDKPLPNSDAVLNCPACMTTLCLDCQRHHLYKSQYRAMFVRNCQIDKTELLTYPQASKKRKRNGKMSASPEDQFNPVKCTECNTVVAVFDNEELYHFFNVLASY